MEQNPENDIFCNFLVGAPKKIKCHKNVLAAISPVFHKMFYGNLKENCSKPIQLPDVDPYAFEMLLEFACNEKIDEIEKIKTCVKACVMPITKTAGKHRKVYEDYDDHENYNDCVRSLDKLNVGSSGFIFEKNIFDKLYEIFYCAEKYIVPEFKNYCVGAIHTIMDISNFPGELILPIYSAAWLIDSATLKAKCEQKIKSNPVFYLTHPYINKLKVNGFIAVIDLLFKYHYDKTRNQDHDFYKTLFDALERYAEQLADDDEEKPRTVGQLKELFSKLVDDNRMNRKEFVSGPGKSSFLTKDEAMKVLERFHSTDNRLSKNDLFEMTKDLKFSINYKALRGN